MLVFETVATVRAHPQICCLDFSHDGWLLCSVGADSKSTVNIWDWAVGTTIVTAQAGPGPINAFRFNPYQVSRLRKAAQKTRSKSGRIRLVVTIPRFASNDNHGAQLV